MDKRNNRILTLDILKGIAIILVIFAHCIQYGSGIKYLSSENFYQNPIFIFIYSFHMPLFMLISGYLFHYAIQNHTTNYIIKKRIKSLIIPIISWQTLWLIFAEYQEIGNHNTFYYINSYINTLWFLSSLFINSFIVIICNRYANDSTLLYFSIFIISLFIPNYHNYNMYVFMLPYFLCGYFFNKCKDNFIIVDNIKAKILITIFLLSIFTLLLLHYDTNDYVYTSGTFIIRHHQLYIPQIKTDAYRWFIGFIGALCIILVIVLFFYKKNNITNVLCKIGTKTMGLYIISTYIFKFYYLFPISSFNYTHIIVESIVIISISYILTLIIEQNEYTKKILLGGR